MKKYFYVILLICFVIGISGCISSEISTSSNDNNSNGTSGDIASSDFSNINNIVYSGKGNLIIETGADADSLTINSHEDGEDDHEKGLINHKIEGNTLTINNMDTHDHESCDVVLKIKSKNIKSVSGNGPSNITLNGISSDSFTATVDSGNLTVNGNSSTITLTVNGNGIIDAKNLVGSTGTVTVNGEGKILTNVSGTLTATVNGKGNVGYSGNPTLTSNANSGGTITKI
ncbi:MAG: DUF2807 domain-containing protein [Methanobacteriaceae archaeon]|nr:DUF2807 domain-containing protein [Methanobacteriaceae archaeon]